MKMITRFSLYGFLKNLDFSEPFLILFYLSIGLNFFQIGVLVSFLNICINIMEVPSGALADIYGRKNSMVLSLTSYIIAFAVFAFSHSYAPLFVAVFFFSIGEAFRTGTHKAMIFDWLRQNDRLSEKTRVYGFTRSWSKYGSALSVVISTMIILFSQGYRWIFIFSIVPYIVGVWNMLSYPAYLNKRLAERLSLRIIFTHTLESIKTSFSKRELRTLIVKSMGFEGVFEVTKDYLQPVIKAQAVALAAVIVLPEKERTAIIIGIVYFILHIISANASRQAHVFSSRFKTEEKAINFMIVTGFVLVLISALTLHVNWYIVAIIAYVAYYTLQNLWRPILVALYDNHADSSQQAAILSIESQTKTVGITVLAPLAGFMADRWGIESALMLFAVILLGLWLYSLGGARKSLVRSN